MTASETQEQRATKKDWAKACLCSALLLVAWFFLCGPKIGGGFGSGLGAGFGFAGKGPGGEGRGEGVGVGNKDGIGDSGTGKGGEESGDAGGGESDRANMGGKNKAKSIFTFGSNSELAEGVNPNLVAKNTDGTKPARTSSDGGNQSEKSASKKFAGDKRFGGSDQNTFAIIQPNAAPATPTKTANRFVGGKGRSGYSGGASTSRSIGGMNVRGTTLGVVLDTSGSMSPYLDELRAEIRRNFSNAIFLEVNGCSLHVSDFDPEEFLDGRPPKKNRRSSVMDAMMELVLVYNVDSIYWFSDLQDGRHQNALRQLRNLVWGQEMPELTPEGFASFDKRNAGTSVTHGPRVRLYVRSTDNEPKGALAAIIRESGGKAQVKR